MARQSLKSVCRLINQNADSPVEKEFLADLKRSIELTDSANRRKPSQTYKPSSMNCIRNMYYQVTGQEAADEPANYSLIGICESGTDRHERVQSAISHMKDHGIDCEYIDVGEYVKSRGLVDIDVVAKQGNETKLFDKHLNMSFLCDGIIRYKGRYYIVEIKTESIYKWQSRTGVNPEHYNQAISYSNSLQLDNVIFIYINRDNTDMKSYMYEVTDSMRNSLISRIKECDNFVQAGICPPKPCNVSVKTCQYCNYKSLCSKEG